MLVRYKGPAESRTVSMPGLDPVIFPAKEEVEVNEVLGAYLLRDKAFEVLPDRQPEPDDPIDDQGLDQEQPEEAQGNEDDPSPSIDPPD